MLTVHQVAKTIQTVNAADPTRFVYRVDVSVVQFKSLESEMFQYSGHAEPAQHCKGCKCDRQMRVCGVPVSAEPVFAPEIVHFATKPRSHDFLGHDR